MSLLTKVWAHALGEEGAGHANGFDALEPRALLDSTLPFVLYSPEGYASDLINEFVPITNPSSEVAEYELWARYETGERDQLIASGTIAALSRGGVTVSDSQNPGATVVRKDTPFALELRSSVRVTATLSHYDFDSAIGESFTSTTSLQWTFGDVQKNATDIRDFILVFNTSDLDSTVTITIYGQNGIAHTESHEPHGIVSPMHAGHLQHAKVVLQYRCHKSAANCIEPGKILLCSDSCQLEQISHSAHF